MHKLTISFGTSVYNFYDVYQLLGILNVNFNLVGIASVGVNLDMFVLVEEDQTERVIQLVNNHSTVSRHQAPK